MPKQHNTRNDMDKFYREVKSSKDPCKQYEMIVVMEDLIAKVGSERFDKVVGPWELGDRNDSGERWIEWCMENKKIIGNTWFRHHLDTCGLGKVQETEVEPTIQKCFDPS